VIAEAVVEEAEAHRGEDEEEEPRAAQRPSSYVHSLPFPNLSSHC
jgi:hypothetical protein